MRILHVIPGLQRGGAETQLTRLLARDPEGAAVFCLRPLGPQADDIERVGVRVYSGGAKSRWSPGWIPSLSEIVEQHKPEVLCGWLYHGNLAAWLAGKRNHGLPVVWNILHSLHALPLEKLATRWVIRVGATLSSGIPRIVYNSDVAAAQHEAVGYSDQRRIIIPNGFDMDLFKPNPEARVRIRKSLGVEPGERLIGVVGRAHPVKNHAGFIRVIKTIAGRLPHLKVVVAGRDVNSDAGGLPALVKQLELDRIVTLMPETAQPELLYPAMDLFVLPSFSEAFPNVVGEAMACGTPCIVFNVGDAAKIVGDTGRVVRAGDESGLAAAIAEMLELPGAELREFGQRSRKRIDSCYSLSQAVDAYRRLWTEVVNERRSVSGSRT